MSNALFMTTNYADFANIAASSEIATAPASNLQVDQRSAIWRSASGVATVNLDYTLLSTLQSDYVAVVDTNMTISGTIRVRAWDDAINGSVLTIDQTVNPALYTDPVVSGSFYNAGNYNAGTYGAFPDYNLLNRLNVTLVKLATPVTSRFWRITLTDANISFYTLSRVYICKALTFGLNLAYGFTAGYDERSVFRESIGGQRYSQPREPRLRITGSFAELVNAERDITLLTLKRYGERKPFVFSVYPEGNSNEQKLLTDYGRFSGPRVTQEYFSLNPFSFQFVQEL